MASDDVLGAGCDGSTQLPPMPADLAARVTALLAEAAAISSYDVTQLDGRAALALDDALTTVANLVGVTQARVLPVVEADGLWGTTAARSFSTWVAARHRSGAVTAQAQVRLGRALRDHLPLTAAAAARGEITVEHAHVLARLASTTQARRDALADPASETGEAWLVQSAKLHGVDGFRQLVRYWAAAADPDADDRGYVEASDREYLELSQTPDGYHLRGQLTVDHGQALKEVLRAITPVPAVDDDRTTSQRRAQALHDLCRLGLDHGLVGTGRAVRPRIGVLVTHPTLVNLAERAAARRSGAEPPAIAPALTVETVLNAPRFEDGTPVPRTLLDRLACDGEINRYIFGPDSEILDVGRAERTFTKHMRSAIIARDRHCQFPGCTAPPAMSEGHHVKHWSRDQGDTSVRNGILLCWFHHEFVHKRDIDIRWTRAGWVFERDGIRIGGGTGAPIGG